MVGVRTRYSDTMLIFLLKGNLPKKYGDKLQQTHRSDGTAPIQIVETDDWYGTPLGAGHQAG